MWALRAQQAWQTRRIDNFHGLIANFCSLKTKKIPAGRVSLGDQLGFYMVAISVGIFAFSWSGSLQMIIRGFWQQLQWGSAPEVTLVLGSASVALLRVLTPVALW